MSTAEQSESDAEFASRLEAQVEAMAGETYRGSPFGDDASNYGTPAPMGVTRYGSVPATIRAMSVEPGRFSMPPPSLPMRYTPNPQERSRMASHPQAVLSTSQYNGSPHAAHAMPGNAVYMHDQANGTFIHRAQTRSPMPMAQSVYHPQRSVSVQHGIARHSSGSRYQPYPNRLPQQPQAQMHASMPPAQQRYMQHPPHEGYQSNHYQESMQNINPGFVPQMAVAEGSQNGSPQLNGLPPGESPSINPLALAQAPPQTSHANITFQPYSAGIASHTSGQHQENDGSHIPIQSPAGFPFEGMVATGSYSNTEAAASGWPVQQEPDDTQGRA
jgi:hypothetical protein